MRNRIVTAVKQIAITTMCASFMLMNAANASAMTSHVTLHLNISQPVCNSEWCRPHPCPLIPCFKGRLNINPCCKPRPCPPPCCIWHCNPCPLEEKE